MRGDGMAKRTTLRSVAGAACILAALAAAAPAMARDATGGQEDTVKIRIRTADTEIAATLDDNATARDFISLLPLTLTLKDYASTEMVADLPRRLDTDDAPAGIDPSVGDITYYAPWGNLAIFYRDFGYARGLVRLGRIDSGIGELAGADGTPVTVELMGE